MKERSYLKNISARYGLYQVLFYLANSGLYGFSVTYLLEKGFTSTRIGMILAISSFSCCILQPVLGGILDRVKRFIYPVLMGIFLGCGIACILVMLLMKPSIGCFGILYGLTTLFVSVNMAVNNSLCVYYTEHRIHVNYSVGIGIGSLAYSFGSLGIGYLMYWLGADSMLWLVLILLVVSIITVMGYRSVKDDVGDAHLPGEIENMVSLPVFFGKYRKFMVAVVGVMLVAMCHSMSENYMINIFQKIGGGSQNVGTALFVACITATPIYLFFEKVQKKIDVSVLMKLAALLFMLKVFLFTLATSVGQMYAIELFQTVTYGIFYPSLFYFAKRSIPMQDKSKAQAVIIAGYSLGAALGSLIGGRVIDLWGLQQMLYVAIGVAFLGFLILIFTVKKVPKSQALGV